METKLKVLKGAPCGHNDVYLQGFGVWPVSASQYTKTELLSKFYFEFRCTDDLKLEHDKMDGNFIPSTLRPDCTYKVNRKMSDQELDDFKNQKLVFRDYINVYRKRAIGDKFWIYYAIY